MGKRPSTLIPRKKRRPAALQAIPTLTIMNHPDPGRIGQFARLPDLARGREVTLSRDAPLFKQPGQHIGEALGDPYISRKAIVLRPASDRALTIDCEHTNTLVEVGRMEGGPRYHVPIGELTRGLVLVLAERVVLLLHHSKESRQPMRSDHGLVGGSHSVQFLRSEIERVADLQTPVLLRGASGTGKELVARAIHEAANKTRPFVSVNLGAIPRELAASELFGALKGSFTGADRHQQGYFRAAHGGTLFLDEVGEASHDVQVMLLRALETGEISPLGAQHPVSVNVRLIAATDADLEAKMAEDSFKSPLFYRLAGYEIKLPDLVERMDDFSRLFFHFAKAELGKIGNGDLLRPRRTDEEPWLPPDLLCTLMDYDWPGNIRQLRNAVCQLVIGCRGEDNLHQVPKLAELLHAETEPPPDAAIRIKRKATIITEAELRGALTENNGDVKASAAKLGISRGALYRLIEQTPGLYKATELSAEDIEAGLRTWGGDTRALATDFGLSHRALRRRMTALGIKIG